MKKPMSNWSVMPMPPCICTPSCTARVAVVPARALATATAFAGVIEIAVERLQRLQHRGAGDLDIDIELGGAVLQRLEFADQLAELLALLEIRHGAAENTSSLRPTISEATAPRPILSTPSSSAPWSTSPST